MKIWIGAAMLAAAVSFGGAFASTQAVAAPQPSQKAVPQKQDGATDVSARRRHHMHRHHMHRAYYPRVYAPRYARPYYRSYALPTVYSGRPYGYGYGYGGGYRPAYYGSSFYGGSTFYDRPYGFGGYRGFGYGPGYGGGYYGGSPIGISIGFGGGRGFGGPGFGFGRW